MGKGDTDGPVKFIVCRSIAIFCRKVNKISKTYRGEFCYEKKTRLIPICLSIILLIQSPCFAASAPEADIDEYCSSLYLQEAVRAETFGDGSGISLVAYGTPLYTDTYSDGTNTWRIEYTDAGTDFISKEFVQYLTNVWAKNNSSYTITESVTVSVSTSGGISVALGKNISASLGWNQSISTSTSYGTVINVQYPDQYNKLGLLADYNIQYVIPKSYKNGVLNSTGNQNTIKSPTDLYYQVIYQSS